ncbi:hypothetical protein NT06LI_3170a, partial [Listeria innocua FSL J1-023]
FQLLYLSYNSLAVQVKSHLLYANFFQNLFLKWPR